MSDSRLLAAAAAAAGRRYRMPIVYVPLLDRFSNAVAGFSTARRLTASSTICLDVRRSSDSTIQTFGYDANGNLDTAALLAFVGAGNGVVTAIYDQTGPSSWLSGNGTIVNAGSLVTVGASARPAASLGSAGTDRFTTNTSAWGNAKGLSGDAPFTVFVVYRKDVNAAGGLFGWGDTGTSLRAAGYYDDGSISQMAYAGGNGFNTSTPATATHYLATFTKSAGAINSSSGAYRNGASVATSGHSTTTPNLSGATPFYVGTWSSYTVNKLQGAIQEVIVFYGDKSSDLAAIEADIRTFYGI